MPLFDYTGQLPSGAAFQGTIEADAQEAAQATLARMGVRVLTLRAAKRTALVTPLSLDEFTFFNEQLAAMTKAAIPLEEGLRQLAADVGSRKLKRLLLDLAGELASGTPLEQALERHRRRFPPQYAGVVGAGLKTGDLGGTLYGLTTHLRLQSSVRRSVLEAGAYPLIVLLLALLLISFLMRQVVPKLLEMMDEMTADIGPSEAATAVYTAFRAVANAWPWIEIPLWCALLLVILAFTLLYVPGIRPAPEWLVRHLPGFGGVYWSGVLARFAHTTALGAYSGTPLPELVAASGLASGSPALERATRRVAERLQAGDALPAAAAAEPLVPALWTCAVEVAAPRGDLAGTLAELARAYELRAQHCAATLRALMGPILFLVVACVLGGTIGALFGLFSRFLLLLIHGTMMD